MAAPTLTLLWASAAPQDLYFRQVGGIQSGPVEGVQSCYEAPIENYDEEVYRDSFLNLLIAQLNSGIAATYNGSVVLAALNTVPEVTLAAATAAAPIESTVPADSQTTSDEVLHIPPRPTLKKRSLLLFYNAATSAGSVVHSCWADEYIGCSTAAFTYI